MDKLKHLLDVIKNDHDVQRFQQLEHVIDHNEDIRQTYKELLRVQKLLVQAENSGKQRVKDAQKKYEVVYNKLLSFAPMQEYLDLLEGLNTDLNLIQSIIENELSIDFD